MNCVSCVILETMYNKTINKFVFFVRLSVTVTVDFLKVRLFSFPVPVVGSSFYLALRAREKPRVDM